MKPVVNARAEFGIIAAVEANGDARRTVTVGEPVVLWRDMAHEARAVADGEVELTFSSESPVKRWGEDEVLLHSSAACDLTRLSQVGAVLKNHNPSQIVGMPTRVWLGDDRRGHALMKFGSTPAAKEAEIETVTDKSLRGVSVGYKVNQWMYFEKSGQHDGRTYAAGTWLATNWQPLEISLTPVPADWTVGVGRSERAMPAEKEHTMKDEIKKEEQMNAPASTAEAPVAQAPEARSEPDVNELVEQRMQAERARCKDIRAIGQKYGVDTQEFIDAGATVDAVRVHVLEVLAERGKTRPNPETQGRVEVTQDGRISWMRACANGILMRAGGTLNDEDRKSANVDAANWSLVRLAEDCLRRAGLRIPQSASEIVADAMRGPRISAFDLNVGARHGETISVGTSDFPFILANAANKEMLAGAKTVVVSYPMWCKIGSGTDFKAMSRLKLSEAGELPVVAESAGYTTTKFSEQRETITLATYGKCYNLSRQAIINDDLNAFIGVPRALGRAAAFKPNILAVSVLCANGNMADSVALFHATHSNLSGSADHKLDTVDHARAGIANLWAMLAKQTAMKHGDLSTEVGIYASSMLKTVLTPITGHFLAASAIGSSSYGSGVEGVNPLAGRGIQVVPEPLLEHALVSGYSAIKYYGFADPADSPVIEVAFLNGNTNPYQEEVENTGTGADGRVFKVRLDCAAAKVDWRGAVREDSA
ncbi:MAG: HK97 family phage prohead protease [Verrucomicrobiota bacterium]